MSVNINADTTNGLVLTSDTSGEIELKSNGVTKAKITANGLQDANGNSIRGGSYRNLIINGDMRIAQRGTSVTGITSGGYQTVDRFYFPLGTVGTWTQTQETDVPTGQGFSTSLKMQCTTANASLSASSYMQFEQKIEGLNLQHLKYGTANAEKVTVSFWVKSNKTGTYVGRLYTPSPAKASHITFTINLSDTWEKKTLTFNGDTSTTLVNSNAEGFRFTIWLAAGSIFTSGTQDGNNWVSYTAANTAAALTVNLADSTSNYINITGVQLEVGEGASDFEFLPYDVQLQRCQRYYEKITFVDAQYFLICVHYITGTQSRGILPYSYKRTNPTITFNGSYTANPGPNQAVTPTANGASYTSSRIDCVTTNSGSVGTSIILIGYPSTNIEILAEL